jgi:hypothetical protein
MGGYGRLGVAVAVLASAVLYLTASASAAPVATIVAEPRHVDLQHMTNLQSPAWPKGAFINRPTVSLAQYQAAQRNRSAGTRPGMSVRAPQSPSPLTVTNVLGFNGITQATAESTWPSDINGAVGGLRTAEIVNQHLTAWKKDTQEKQVDRSLATITGYTAQPIFDPRIVFDPQWQRWVFEAEAFPENATTQYIFIGVSTSNFPGGGYSVYQLNITGICGEGGFWDYPSLGMNQDAIVETANCFNSKNEYEGAKTFGVAKALVYNGLGFSVPVFGMSSADSTATPALVFDQNPNMDLITRNGPDDVVFDKPANAYFSAGLTSDTKISGDKEPSVPRPAGQKGCTEVSCEIDTGDGRFVAPSTEFGGQLWNVATYGLSGSGTFATPHWGEFNTTTHETTQQGEAIADGCSDDFNASLAVGPDLRMAINWTSSDPSGCGETFVRQFVGGRLSTTAAGTLSNIINPFTSPAELTGNFDSNFGLQRWGDTSSMSRDPSDNTKFWAWNQSVPTSNEWGTRATVVTNKP